MSKTILRREMIRDSNLIKDSVEFLKTKIEEKLVELDDLLYNNRDYRLNEKILLTECQIRFLLLKIKNEEIEMDKFLTKYSKISNEKQNMSFSSGEKGPIYLRSVSFNEKGKSGGSPI